MNIGVLYKDNNKLNEALTLFNESIKLARETDNSLGISKISGNLAQLHLQMYGNQGIQMSQELIYGAYDTIKDRGDEVSLQYAMMNIGILEAHKAKYDVALNWFTQILGNFRSVDAYVKQISLDNAHQILTKLGRLNEAATIGTTIDSSSFTNKDVLFVLDCSGSMSEHRFIGNCKTHIEDIITRHLTNTDRISMMVFNNKLINLFTNKNKIADIDEMTGKIYEVTADGQTAFYDALISAITIQLTGKKGDDFSKWIVALTDGEDTCSKQKSTDVKKMLKDISINLIIITVGALSNRDEIQGICDSAKIKGKGILIEISRNSEELNKAFETVAKLIVGQLHVESL